MIYRCTTRLNDTSREMETALRWGKGCFITSNDGDKQQFSRLRWWWGVAAAAAAGCWTDSVADGICTRCYLSEGWSFKEGRKGHESLQQSGRKDGKVTGEREKVAPSHLLHMEAALKCRNSMNGQTPSAEEWKLFLATVPILLCWEISHFHSEVVSFSKRGAPQFSSSSSSPVIMGSVQDKQHVNVDAIMLHHAGPFPVVVLTVLLWTCVSLIPPHHRSAILPFDLYRQHCLHAACIHHLSSLKPTVKTRLQCFSQSHIH